MASAKLDNRGSFGSKRSRHEDSRDGGDWTCTQCGNINFAFRIVCNRGKCGAPRPSASPQRRDSLPMHEHFNYPAPYYVGGVGAPPVSHMPPVMPNSYGPPFSFSGMRYDIRAHGNAPGPYGHLSAYPPRPIGGMGYGPARAMDEYGYGFQGSPMPGQWSGGSMADNSALRKRRGVAFVDPLAKSVLFIGILDSAGFVNTQAQMGFLKGIGSALNVKMLILPSELHAT
ncbi:ranBP2-type zinc finger protein At1g67325-like isoform X3 [Papaver somniferum]|uniref:ranBP2-type zinc finger protein At1g67325-like isoform X3 n=1 Tax=Papaver somniferum TaxID=3469 RepID=UPI000E6FCF26|nr:ranBP2-type zinc finger protein At1g67325-like isoform X3 [Papaver somniferum]